MRSGATAVEVHHHREHDGWINVGGEEHSDGENKEKPERIVSNGSSKALVLSAPVLVYAGIAFHIFKKLTYEQRLSRLPVGDMRKRTHFDVTSHRRDSKVQLPHRCGAQHTRLSQACMPKEHETNCHKRNDDRVERLPSQKVQM